MANVQKHQTAATFWQEQLRCVPLHSPTDGSGAGDLLRRPLSSGLSWIRRLVSTLPPYKRYDHETAG